MNLEMSFDKKTYCDAYALRHAGSGSARMKPKPRQAIAQW
jgi:hypothetical protein